MRQSKYKLNINIDNVPYENNDDGRITKNGCNHN